MTVSTEDFLSHYGVRGMKWGVHNGTVRDGASRSERKAAKKASKLAYKAWKKEVGGEKVANEIFQEALKTSKPAINRINNSSTFKGKDLTKDYALAREYDRKISETFNDHMATASLTRTTTNTGRAMLYQFDRSLGMMRATEVQAVFEHADDEAYPDFVAEMDDLGQIVSIRRADEDEFLEQMENAADFLEHYGVKGMKWGHRKSGGVQPAKKGRLTEDLSEEAERLSGVHVRTKTQKSTKMLSNKELQDAIKRMQLEQQYSQLSGGIDKTARQKASAFISGMVMTSGKQGSQQMANDQAKKQFQKAFEFAKKAGRG